MHALGWQVSPQGLGGQGRASVSALSVIGMCRMSSYVVDMWVHVLVIWRPYGRHAPPHDGGV